VGACGQERGCRTQSPDIIAHFNISILPTSIDIIYRAVWGVDNLPLEDWESLFESQSRHFLCLCFPAPSDETPPPPIQDASPNSCRFLNLCKLKVPGYNGQQCHADSRFSEVPTCLLLSQPDQAVNKINKELGGNVGNDFEENYRGEFMINMFVSTNKTDGLHDTQIGLLTS